MKDKEFYNIYFYENDSYKNKYNLSNYYELWEKIIYKFNEYKINRIIDFGCGTGQFAEMCKDNNIQYIGIDFSKVAIDIAKKRIEEKTNLKFIECDFIKDFNSIKDLIIDNTIVSLETLEHIDDIGFLKLLPKNNIFFSVPSFGAESHLRFFNSLKEVYNRYDNYINFIYLEKFGSYFLGYGVIK